MSDDEDIVGVAPVDFFFSKEIDCHQIIDQKQFLKKCLLPPLSEVFGQETFARVFMGWKIEGLVFEIQVTQRDALVVSYPDISQGDSIELFIDTRAIASAKTTHRFCHHFYFLPEHFEGRQCGECTRFRTEDAHPLCSEELLECTILKNSKGYAAQIMIPKDALVGYDPQKGSKIGFTYRINRSGAPSQHFAMSYEHARIDTMPGLWAQMRLT